jgi:glycosyltransferase involved in cell wall biosynthesis
VVGDPTFAIIVPTLNAESTLGRLLRSVQAQSNASYAVAVVDEASSDGTVQVARDYGCTVVNVPSRSSYAPPGPNRNLGAQAVEGRILVHLDADMELASPDFLTALARAVDEDHEAAILTEHDLAVGFWGRCKALERSCYRGTGLEGARAVTRRLFNAVGGYDQLIASGEDIYITSLYVQLTVLARGEALTVWHHIGRPSLFSLLGKKFAYGRAARAYVSRVGTGSGLSPSDITRMCLAAYLRNWRLLGTHPLLYLSILPLRALEFASVSLGLLLGPAPAQSAAATGPSDPSIPTVGGD